MTWELKGKYPRIFEDPVVGKQARDLFDDARRCSTGSCGDSDLTAQRRLRLLPGQRRRRRHRHLHR